MKRINFNPRKNESHWWISVHKLRSLLAAVGAQNFKAICNLIRELRHCSSFEHMQTHEVNASVADHRSSYSNVQALFGWIHRFTCNSAIALEQNKPNLQNFPRKHENQEHFYTKSKQNLPSFLKKTENWEHFYMWNFANLFVLFKIWMQHESESFELISNSGL